MNSLSWIAIIVIIFSISIGFTKRVSMTNSLIMGNLVVYFLTIISLRDFGFFAISPVQLELGFRPVYLISLENFYTLFTQMFVHSSIAHILFNMLFLYLIGGHLELRIGKSRFFVIYLLAGLLGVLMESLVQWGSNVLIIGASGAISGAMGALLLLYPREEIPMFLGPLFLPRVPVWLSVGSWFAIQVVMVFIDSGPIAYTAHIGGFLGGALIASVMSPGIKAAEQKKQEVSRLEASALESLATTQELKNALAIIREERFEDVRKAWLEYFVKRARCPKCGSSLSFNGFQIRCTSCDFVTVVR
ncbi:MAG: rhomboid family intramembrane serine protease [Methanomassiliicoccales archaeon]|jgi:membrane associated rhomboid family serine protease|nr:rhomboid family intramembrane serine protease [Methanomassiliicoccales archaeon]